jgi:hypothetical protein
MADQNAFDRRRFFQRFRLRVSSPDVPGGASVRPRIDRLPSDDPAVVRPLVVDWRSDVAPSWEDGALEVYTQAGAIFRWELSTVENAFLRGIDGQRSIGSLHDAVDPDAPGVPAGRIALLTALLEAGVLRVVRSEPAPAGSD